MESSVNLNENREKNTSKLYSLLPKDLVDEIENRTYVKETNKDNKDIQLLSKFEKDFEYSENKIKKEINSIEEIEDNNESIKNTENFQEQNIINKIEDNFIKNESSQIKNYFSKEKINNNFIQNPYKKNINNEFTIRNEIITGQIPQNIYDTNMANKNIKYCKNNLYDSFTNNPYFCNPNISENINKSGKIQNINKNNILNRITDINQNYLNSINNLDQNNLQPFKSLEQDIHKKLYNTNDVNNFFTSQEQRNINILNSTNLYPREYNYSRVPSLDYFPSSDFNQNINYNYLVSKNEQINPNYKEVSEIIILINKIGIDSFIKFVKTHKGSIYLQNILFNKKLSRNEISYIVNSIGTHFNDIICDYYGNYFFQKFILLCYDEDRINIYHYIKNNFIKISTNMCGNHSLKCLISLLSTEEEKKLIKDSIISDLKNLCFDQNGASIIAKIILTIKESERNYINEIIVNYFTELSTNINGIIIVRTFIKEIESHMLIKKIVLIAENNLNIIVTNQYGYLVIKDIIEILGYETCKKIINLLIDKIVHFSILKYSSNIIIFILYYLLKNNLNIFIKILKIVFINENNLKEMIQNKFSTFVIEKALELMNKIDSSFFKGKINLNNNKANKSSINDEQFFLFSKNKKINEVLQENDNQEDNLDYQQFLDLKEKIYIIFEHNTTNKEKQKILDLIRNKGTKNNNNFH